MGISHCVERPQGKTQDTLAWESFGNSRVKLKKVAPEEKRQGVGAAPSTLFQMGERKWMDDTILYLLYVPYFLHELFNLERLIKLMNSDCVC